MLQTVHVAKAKNPATAAQKAAWRARRVLGPRPPDLSDDPENHGCAQDDSRGSDERRRYGKHARSREQAVEPAPVPGQRERRGVGQQHRLDGRGQKRQRQPQLQQRAPTRDDEEQQQPHRIGDGRTVGKADAVRADQRGQARLAEGGAHRALTGGSGEAGDHLVG